MQRSVTFARKYFHPVASYAPAYTPFELEQSGQINSPCVEQRRRVARKHFHQVLGFPCCSPRKRGWKQG